jgi:hypothetical protein
MGRVEFYALRRISPGEEITVNYGETHHEGKLAARAGEISCQLVSLFLPFAAPACAA